MVRSSRSSARATLALVIVGLAGASASAHRLDEYLQAARVMIEPDHVDVELDLTPGVAVTGVVLPAIDRNRDGTISEDEARGYAAAVVSGLTLEIDGVPAALRVRRTGFPALQTLRDGMGTIQIRLAAALPALRPGAHRVRLRNDHLPAVSAYLANALVPASDRVDVTNQRRDYNQRVLDVDYVLREDRAMRWWGAGFGAALIALMAFVVQQKGSL
jgi:hypothetical protein